MSLLKSTDEPIAVEAEPVLYAGYLAETWELVELVCAGCPEEPLKVFRKSLITSVGGRKILTARQADAAIGSAQCTIRTGPIIGRNKREAIPELPTAWLVRAMW